MLPATTAFRQAPLRQSQRPLVALTFKLCSGQEWLVTKDHVGERLFGILSTNTCSLRKAPVRA